NPAIPTCCAARSTACSTCKQPVRPGVTLIRQSAATLPPIQTCNRAYDAGMDRAIRGLRDRIHDRLRTGPVSDADDNLRAAPGAVAAWNGEQHHPRWIHPHPAGDCRGDHSDPHHPGATTRLSEG